MQCDRYSHPPSNACDAYSYFQCCFVRRSHFPLHSIFSVQVCVLSCLIYNKMMMMMMLYGWEHNTIWHAGYTSLSSVVLPSTLLKVMPLSILPAFQHVRMASYTI